MCIILHTTKKLGLPTEDRLKDNFNFNPDGAGYAIVYTKGKRKKIEHQKGFDKFDTYNLAVTKAFSKLKEDDDYIVLHMRIATSGGTSLDKTHPFKAKDGTLIFQNGICPVTVTKHLKKDESDTEWIANNYVDPDWVKKNDSSSRWVIIKPDGELIKLGTWVTDSAGRSWSNGTYSGYTYPRWSGYGYGRSYYDDHFYEETYDFERGVLSLVFNQAIDVINILTTQFRATYTSSLKAISVRGSQIYLDKYFATEVLDGVYIIGELSPHAIDNNIFQIGGKYIVHTRTTSIKGHGKTIYLSSVARFIEYLVGKKGLSGEYSINHLGVDWGATYNNSDGDMIVKALNDYFDKHHIGKVARKHKKSINIENRVMTESSETFSLNKTTLDKLNKDLSSWLRQYEVMDDVKIVYAYVHANTMKLYTNLRVQFSDKKWSYSYPKAVTNIRHLSESKFFGIVYDDYFMDIFMALTKEV